MMGTPQKTPRSLSAETHARGRVERCARIVRRLSAPVRFAAQAALDFIVEDRCTICGSPPSPDPRDPRGHTPMAAAVQRRLFGAIPVRNHPFCRRCLLLLDKTRSVGTLGRRVGRGAILTVSGHRFESPELEVTRDGDGAVNAAMAWPLGVCVVAPFMTNDNALKIIHLLKFSGYRELARPIAATIASVLEPTPARAVFAVPGHRRRWPRVRANHAEAIAACLATQLRIPLIKRGLLKRVHTRRQSQTPHERRADNVRTAFGYAGPPLDGLSVVLVDDLVTTGATAAACGAVLLEAGARELTVACFARAL